MLDVLIRHGWVVDGTGNPAFPADVAIQGERIVDVGRLEGAQAARVIDATGKIVRPGFIDAHSHSDSSILATPTADSTIRQGITTEVVGNCGGSPAPLTDASRDLTATRLRKQGYPGAVEWTTFGDYLGVLDRMGMSENLAIMVGHNALRSAAGVRGPQPTEDQFRVMENHLREAMAAGAIGLSSGLEFEPGRQAKTEELIRLNRIVGQYGGIYASHPRNRDAQAEAAAEEVIEIARQGGTRGQIAHWCIRHNTATPEGTWERSLASVEKARREGVDVLADSVAYTDGGGSMASILPPWVREGGPVATAERLRDPAIRARLRTDCDRYWRFLSRGDWHRARVRSSPEFPEVNGKNFVEISQMWGRDPWDCYFDLLAAAGPRLDSMGLMGILYTEEHLAQVHSHPLIMLAVDSATTSVERAARSGMAHPIQFAAMTHYITVQVRERRILRLEEAVRKMTSMPATHFRLGGRGLLRPGQFADVAVFDFDRLEEVSTVEQPLAYVRGVEYVLVKSLVVDGGEHTGARPGRVLVR